MNTFTRSLGSRSALGIALLSSALLAACGGTSNAHGESSATPAGSESATSSSGGASSTPTSDTSTTDASATSESTASTAPSESAPSASPSAPAVADAAVHVQSVAGAAGWFARIDMERRADGALLFAGHEIARMQAGHITTIDGQSVPLDGRLSIGVRGHREHMEIQPDHSVVMDAGRVTVDPSGDVQLTRGSVTRPVHVHIAGYTPETASLAAILLVYGVMKADLATR